MAIYTVEAYNLDDSLNPYYDCVVKVIAGYEDLAIIRAKELVNRECYKVINVDATQEV